MKGLTPPHILLAASNPLRMIQNLNHLLTPRELRKLVTELDSNVRDLFILGREHFDFATQLQGEHWRHKISRLYYAVYHARRAVVLKHSGSYSTDASDHKNVEQLPDTLPNREQYINQLRNLREDRNLADYGHSAVIDDLILAPGEAEEFATQFLAACHQFLQDNGIEI
jgi:uncharacterized protein (UPF0332 family)